MINYPPYTVLLFNNYPANGTECWLIAKIMGYSTRLSRIIVFSFNISFDNKAQYCFIMEKLETIFFCYKKIVFSPTHEIMYITEYLLCTDDE